MPKCKYCHENITKFDKEICPFCGGKKPLDGVDDSTYDITQYIDILNNDKDAGGSYTPKKKKTYAFLCMFLGFFGAHNFYIGFKKKGIVELVADILIYAIASLVLYFFTPLTFYSFIIPFAAIFLVYFIYSFFIFKNDDLKDSKGVFLR